MFSLVSMKNAEQLNNNHQANKCSVFWFREMPILFPFAFQRSAMSFPCVFSITAAWLNVSHGAFSAPHPMLISCGGLLWDSEREGHHQRDREQRPALTLSVKTRLCWEGHVHVTLTSQLLIYTFHFFGYFYGQKYSKTDRKQLREVCLENDPSEIWTKVTRT